MQYEQFGQFRFGMNARLRSFLRWPISKHRNCRPQRSENLSQSLPQRKAIFTVVISQLSRAP